MKIILFLYKHSGIVSVLVLIQTIPSPVYNSNTDSLAQQIMTLTSSNHRLPFSSRSILAISTTINYEEMQTVYIKKAPSLITCFFLQGMATHLP